MLLASAASAQAVNPEEVDYAENTPITEAVGTYSAVDPEGADIMWDVGGTDAASFSIDAAGVLTFKKSPDFEMQSSYSVDVMANEAMLLTVTVTITNEQEPGTVELTQPQPQVGRSVEAELEDDDGVPAAGVMWEWAKSADKVTWDVIDGAESDDYTPQPGDVGMYLRATATYDDAAAPDDDSATRDVNEGLVSTSDDTGISEKTVEGDPSANAAPAFPDEVDPAGTADPMAISIPENSTGAIDDPVTATDADNDIRLYTLDETPDENATVVARADGAARFEIDARSGQISVTDGTVLNFDDDTEITGGNNEASYAVTVTATDPSGAYDMVEVTITVTDVDEPPVFDESTETVNPTEVSTAEDQDTALGQAYTAPDPDTTVDNGVNWTVSDDTNFTITGGSLAFVTGVTPDYEKQSEYVITITATGNRTSPVSTVSASIEVTVKITDVAEEGTVTLSARQPQVGKAVTAKLDEMDGNPTSIQWRWTTVATAAECTDSTGFDDIEPSSSYMPKAGAGDVGDTGDYLCAQASYFDDAEPADADPPDDDPTSPAPRDITVGASEAVVEVKPISNAKPAFTDGDDEGSDADPVEIEIEENDPGAVGDPVTATDGDGPPPDEEVQDLLLYSLSGPDAASFSIMDRGDDQGQISVADGVTLDFENPSDVGGTAGDNEYVVMVKAADPSGAYDMVEVTIKVTDMDEDPEAPEGITNPSEVDYAENTPITEAVGTYRAVDPEGADIMWDVGGTDAASFSIDAAGVLTFKKSPDFEMQSSYSVDVMANEAMLLTVTVTITNEQEPGTVELTQPQPQVDQSVGTVLEDDDGVPTAGVMWEWAKSADKVTWDVIDGAESDDYTPQPGDVGMYLRATATYDDAAAPDDDSATRDVNEGLVSTSDDTGISEKTVEGDPSANAAPAFPDEVDPAGTADPMAISIPENSTDAIGDPVTATDADNDIRLYTLDETPDVEETVVARTDGAARFEIDARSGQISVTDGTVLNFDDDTEITGGNNEASYAVTVTATDPSGAYGMVEVTITVTDVDEPPVFDESTETVNPTEVSTAEDQDTALGQAYTAPDPDTTVDNGVNWTVSDDTNFTITGGSLAFVTGVTPDYEKQSEYVITITATGNRTSPVSTVSASIEVTVKITDVAEEGTVTLSARQPQVGKAVTAKLDEMDGNPTSIQWRWTTVATAAECTDSTGFDDIEPSSSYMPKAGAGDVGDTGDYLCAQASYFDDAEPADADPPDDDPTSPAPRDITVGASEAVVEVKPISNAKPAFTDGDDEGSDADPVEIEIEENDPGAVGDPVTATDGDGPPPDEEVQDLLLYSLSGPDAASFSIMDRGDDQGQISVADGVTLDFENPSDVGGTAGDNEYVVMVKAADPSGAYDMVEVTITVTDMNEDPTKNNAPEFDSEMAERSVDENTAAGENIGDPIEATDGDTGDSLTYSLDAMGDMYFDIDSATGQLMTEADLDHETQDSYSVTVTAMDTGRLTDTMSVTVTVNDVNEAPTFDAESAELSVDENTEAGMAIGDPIAAMDVDDGDSLMYSLDEMGEMYFDIDSATGQLMTEADLDHETQDSYSVTVTAMDTGRLTDTMSVTVTVNDVNEAPTFDAESAELSVDENTEAGMAIGDPIAAMDVDDGDSLMYSLDEMGEMYFDIDPATGQLMTSAALDYEMQASYSVTVTATDSAGLYAMIAVTITVTDVLEGACAGGAAVADMTNTGLLADCDALLDSEDALGGTLNWDLETDIMDWDGVTVADGRVTRVQLRDMGLDGTIPAELGDLGALDYLVLDQNDLSGAIPTEIGQLSNLRVLFLSDNNLTGDIPTELGDLSSLEWLYLHRNAFTGGIPMELGQLSNVKYLYLYSNEGGLDGGIPNELSQATSLLRLYLHDNGLTGEIPAGLGNLPSLRYLLVHRNELSGEIPSDLGNASNMKALYLYNNMLSGSIPASLGMMVDAKGDTLRLLYLQNNMLSGEVPAELGNLVSLRILRLGGNMLTGCIPAAIAGAAEGADAGGLMACTDDGS